MNDVLSRSYEMNTPDVVSEEFDGQAVILNLATGHYYSLAGIAGPLWSLLTNGHRAGAIIDSLAAQQPQLSADAEAVIGQFVSLGLVREAPAAAPSGPLDMVWDSQAPRLDVFEDLAELIAADPVHDVDLEAGWPVLRPQS